MVSPYDLPLTPPVGGGLISIVASCRGEVTAGVHLADIWRGMPIGGTYQA